MPPLLDAGKNFSTRKPCAESAMASDGVAQPGTTGTGALAKAAASSGGVPGVTRNCAPMLEGELDVGHPGDGADTEHGLRHLAHDSAGGLGRGVGAKRDFEQRQPAGDQRPRERHRLFHALDGEHGQHRDAGEKRRRIGRHAPYLRPAAAGGKPAPFIATLQ